MPDGVQDPVTEDWKIKATAVHTQFIEHWVSQEQLVIASLFYRGVHYHLTNVFGVIVQLGLSILMVFEVKNSEPHNWQRSHSNVVHLVDNFFVKWLT